MHLRLHRFSAITLALLVAATTAAIIPLSAAEKTEPTDVPARIERWQPRVDRYLNIRDKEKPPHTGGIVFTGSSSIDMWQTLATDFPEHRVVNRGIGGTWLADQLFLAPKLVYPLKPHTVVVYAGENDLHAGRSVEDVVIAFEQVRDQIHSELPKARIVFLALKPSPSRTALLEKMRDSNNRIAALCAEDPLCTFVDVFTPMLDARGQPRAELFIEDNLHMNAAGYRLWTSIVAPVLHNLQ